MRILIYGINFSPELTGIGKYSGEMADWLVTQGHEVVVITAPPYYPEWKIKNGFSSWRYRVEVSGRLLIYRCPIWVPRRPTTLARLVHLVSFTLSSIPVVILHTVRGHEIVLVISPTILIAPFGWILARLSGAVAWLHVQDFEIDVAERLGQMNTGLLRKTIAAGEKFLMRKFDRVSTVSSRMRDRLSSKGVESSRQILFPNWVDTDVIYPEGEENYYRRELGIEVDTTVALYAGNMGEKQGLEIIVDVARALQANERIVFVLAGAGSMRADLELYADGLANIFWLPLQPEERLNSLLNFADIHILPQKSGAADLVMPSKLTGMLASGRPVVATAMAGTEVAEIVIGCGRVVTPGSTMQMVESIEELAINPELREELGRNARLYACENMGTETVLSGFQRSVIEATNSALHRE